uniref:Endonuclease/exonuclease/phosphatase domain-containing protein n=1 Tax=Salix viminalis TaxID=40686 RepID=A0A6N2NHR6_SALVM
MKRTAPPVQFLAATLTADSASASMSSRRPPYRGSNNRNQWGRRTFSNRPYTEDSNLGFLHGEANHFSPRPSSSPPPRYYPNQQFRQPPPPQLSDQNRIFWYSPPFNQNHNRQFVNQNHRPQRPAKPLDYRNWEYAKTAPPRDSEKFIVLSYNILADYLAINHRSKLYYHIPRHMLDWEWRKRSIIFELGLWSADIMCFQEVDRFGDLEEALKVRGYSGIWKMRTGNAIDGCAVFWRTSRFRLIHEESIKFNKHGLRDNVAQICVLEKLIRQDNTADASTLHTSSTSSNKVVICNIHVLYNPKRGDIKLGQVRMLLDRAHAVSKTWNDAPVILCGDFNCTPKVTSSSEFLKSPDLSPLYNFISEQKLNFSGIGRDKVSGQASAEICNSRPYDFGRNPNTTSGPLIIRFKLH